VPVIVDANIPDEVSVSVPDEVCIDVPDEIDWDFENMYSSSDENGDCVSLLKVKSTPTI